jgi:hypothetical protein
VYAMQLRYYETILPYLKLKTWPKQLLGSLPLDITLPGVGVLNFYACKGPHTLLTSQREKEKEKERERERKREGEGEREIRERCRIWLFFEKGMTGASAPFSYLVFHRR